MKRNIKNLAVKAIMVLAGFSALAASTGCDEYWATGLGMVDPWYTSGYYGVPEATYYDPTNEIQGVIEYRQSAMDASAAGWSDFILQ
jgi:hypothetical protein